MFGIADHIKNINRNGRPYGDGRSIADLPTFGTTWDQANWLAGWLDALSDEVRKGFDLERRG